MDMISKDDFLKNVNLVEDKLNIQFPNNYIDYLYDHIDKPWKKKINIRSQSYCFDEFFTFIPFDELDILAKYNETKSKVGSKTIPISCTENVLLCLKFNSTNEYELILYKEDGTSVVLSNDISSILK